MSAYKWEDWLDVVAQTRDFNGRSGVERGDRRMSVDIAADKLLQKNTSFTNRKRFLLRLIAAWRLAAEEGLLPHPGQIPNDVEKLSDVPGWAEAEWPEKGLQYYLDLVGPEGPPLPVKSMTKQCDRRRAVAVIPVSYTPLEDSEPNRLLLTFAALGKRLLEIETWTEADCQAWKTHITPMLLAVIDRIPLEASINEREGDEQVDGYDHQGARAS